MDKILVFHTNEGSSILPGGTYIAKAERKHMIGKMVMKAKAVHGGKPEEVIMPDGTKVKSMVAKVPNDEDKVWTRVIDLS